MNNLIINKSSINDHRKQLRKKLANRIHELFPSGELNAAVLHWDGKLMESYSKEKKIDRFAIIVSNSKTAKILSIPALDDGTGLTQATALTEVNKILFTFQCLR